MSTAISEIVLAAVCGYSALLLWRSNPLTARSWAAVAALLTAVAAGLGAIKFGTDIPVSDWHRLAADIAKLVGLPLLALAWVFGAWRLPPSGGGRLLLTVMVVGLFIVDRWLVSVPYYPQWAGSVAMAVVALAAITTLMSHKEYSLLALAGVGQFVLASLVIGTRGSVNGVLAVDLFHYMLAGGWICLAVALRHID